jgi:predicted transcriptional regulator
MAAKDDILKIMKKKGKPMNPGEVEKESGLDKKEFDQAFKELKADGSIVSPVRCKWEPVKK